jgi:hypothetical protein
MMLFVRIMYYISIVGLALIAFSKPAGNFLNSFFYEDAKYHFLWLFCLVFLATFIVLRIAGIIYAIRYPEKVQTKKRKYRFSFIWLVQCVLSGFVLGSFLSRE